MGQLVIEVPQNVKRFYQVESVELGEEILQDLDAMERKMKSPRVPAIIPPRRHSLKQDGDAVLGFGLMTKKRQLKLRGAFVNRIGKQRESVFARH